MQQASSGCNMPVLIGQFFIPVILLVVDEVHDVLNRFAIALVQDLLDVVEVILALLRVLRLQVRNLPGLGRFFPAKVGQIQSLHPKFWLFSPFFSEAISENIDVFSEQKFPSPNSKGLNNVKSYCCFMLRIHVFFETRNLHFWVVIYHECCENVTLLLTVPVWVSVFVLVSE